MKWKKKRIWWIYLWYKKKHLMIAMMRTVVIFLTFNEEEQYKKTFRGHTEAYVYCMAYKNMHFLCSSVLNPFCIRSILLWNIHTRRNWPQIFDYNHLFIIQCTAGQKEIMKRRAVNTEGADGQLSPIFGWSVNPIPTKRRAG